MKRDDRGEIRDEDRIDAEAAEWVIRLGEDESEETLEEFERWRGRDALHAERFDAQASTWDSLEAFSAPLLSHFEEEAAASEAVDESFEQVRVWWKRPLALAAIVAMSLVCWGTFSLWKTHKKLHFTQDFVAEKLDFKHLNDGSFVELNKGARGKADFNRKERRVTLLAGEAHFEVAKDWERPFVVEAGNARIEAVGTAFNVLIRDGDVDVVVSEGVVRVTRLAPQGEDAAASEFIELESTELRAKQRAVVAAKETQGVDAVQTLSTAELQEFLGWKVVQLDFEATPLRDVIKAFNRVSRLQLFLKDETLGDLEIDGRFSSDNRDGLIRMLQLTAGVEVEHDASGRIVISEGAR